MNRAALKTYAPKARLEFICAVTDRAAFFGLTPDRTEAMQETGDVVLIGGRAFPRVVAEQRKKLQERISQHGFDQVMEAMAYTWFNRFVALRYMELHGYLEHGYRVLSQAEGKTTPEILEHAEHVTLPGLDAQQVINLKLDGSREAELYRLLLVAQCNALHEAMPFLFEKIADETELLLPDNLLHSDSLIRKLVNEIDEADWQQVEIIGWLYQFYISDKKDEVIGKMVKSEDIPAATQLFTPNWIVKYLVQNTIGRQWLATYPDSPLRQQMQYYIEPAEQTAEVKAQLAAITPQSLDPETLTLLDPASGSGHILVEAYDLFKAIYLERGYRRKDIPRLILEKNLFGLEIDDRAAQLAAFALLMKARADDRRIFADHVQPNVIAIRESKGLENLLRPDPATAKGAGELPFADIDLFPQTDKQLTLTKPNQESPLAAVEPCLRELINLFEHGKTFGSLIRVPPELAAQLPAARRSIEAMIAKAQLWENRAAMLLLPLVRQAEMLAARYNAVAANPPYMGNNGMNPLVKGFAKDSFPDAKSDLFACFIERGYTLAMDAGNISMVTMQNWMFLSSFQKLRERMLREKTITTMAQIGYNSFPSMNSKVALATAFSLANCRVGNFIGAFIDLNSAPQSADKEAVFLARDPANRFEIPLDEFKRIPGSPLAYNAPSNVFQLFSSEAGNSGVCEKRLGLCTGDNDRFLRFWHEVAWPLIGFQCSSYSDFSRNGKNRYAPHNKGGAFRRWAGNKDIVLKFDPKSYNELSGLCNRLASKSHYFRESLTWTEISSSAFAMRALSPGYTFNIKGPSIFCDPSRRLSLLAYFNSSTFGYLLGFINQSLSFNGGDIERIPFKELAPAHREQIEKNASVCLRLSESDLDGYEDSWDYQSSPVLKVSSKHGPTLESNFLGWVEMNRATIAELKRLEEENNRLFIESYGLANELNPDVAIEQVTLTVNPAYRYGGQLTEDEHQVRFRKDTMQELISYAVGCMMGRYSLDKPGLVYAHSRNEGFDTSQYQTFPADADGIIPITELAWFPDDATERFVEFIGKAWPAEHLEENLKFIADSLGANRDEHPRDTIRRYLSQNFYKDHLQTYKRRPIYWLFSSGKQRAFQCLVYLHRYHEGTLARMRTEYVIPLQGKLSHRIEQLAGDISAATSTSHRRKLEKERETLVKQRTEITTFDEKLRHYADQRIALDLDDGVKVNYAKFGDLLAEVKAVTGATEE